MQPRWPHVVGILAFRGEQGETLCAPQAGDPVFCWYLRNRNSYGTSAYIAESCSTADAVAGSAADMSMSGCPMARVPEVAGIVLAVVLLAKACKAFSASAARSGRTRGSVPDEL